MQQTKLHAEKRTLTGKKIKKLRLDGLVPANLFGKKIESQALTVRKDELLAVFNQTGETGMVSLTVGEEKKEHPVLIVNLQKNHLTGAPLHADFRQVILSEKITANIPLEVVGEPEIVTQKQGVLIQTLNEVEVEALPLDLPEKLVLDASSLQAVGDSLFVKDLNFDHGKVTLKTDEGAVIAKIDALAAEEPAEEAVPAEDTEGGEAAEVSEDASPAAESDAGQSAN